jgi:quinol monooxygenase YgiN
LDALLITATFSEIDPAHREEFKDLIRGLVASTREESGVVQYEWFFSDDETECVLHERYEDSEVVLARMPRYGAQVGRLAELAGNLDVRVFGEPSEELRVGLSAMVSASYRFFAGV